MKLLLHIIYVDNCFTGFYLKMLRTESLFLLSSDSQTVRKLYFVFFLGQQSQAKPEDEKSM